MLNIMPTRYQLLNEIIESYDKTGVLLVDYNGRVGAADDVGSYCFITLVHHYLGLSLDDSIIFFYLGLIMVSSIISIGGFWLILPNKFLRLIASINVLLLSVLSWAISDVYIASCCFTIAVIPWVLYFFRQQKYNLSFKIFLFICGLTLVIASSIRAHAGTGIFLFITYLIIFSLDKNWKYKMKIFAILIVGMAIATGYFKFLIQERDNYLVKNQSNYYLTQAEHPFWHSIYIGFGFLNNPYVSEYKDEVAFAKVQSINPNIKYQSVDYEQTLKLETIKLIKSHPFFFIRTIFAKIGIILFYFLIFFNFGLLSIYSGEHVCKEEGAFIIGILFNSLYGILVIPWTGYLLGFIAFSVLYGIYCINNILVSKGKLT